jgi:hypothetical protein
VLEEELLEAKERDKHNLGLYTQSQTDVSSSNRRLRTKEAELVTMERKLNDEKFERSKLQIRLDGGRHR